jgi:protein-S-isoprenylcysteine O-methyltransferase Ste14
MDLSIVHLVGLSAGWLAYGCLHSGLASRWLKQRLAAWVPGLMPLYRITYNALAVVTLLPLVWWVWRQPGPWLWQWQGASSGVMNGLGLMAGLLLVAGPGTYDLGEFLGIRQLRDPRYQGEDREPFRISRLHRHVRHPWYALSLVILWTRDMSLARLVSALWISGYLVVGSRLEERKLILRFGRAYRDYRSKVPGFLPWPGRSLSTAEARRLEGGGCAG